MRFSFVMFLFTALLWSGSLCAQDRTVPKAVRSKGGYLHAPTRTLFPLHLDSLKRASIHVFDRGGENIGVRYERGRVGRKTTITVSIYPAGEGREGRLREEYLDALYAFSYGMIQAGRAGTELAFEQRPVRYEGDPYICNGFRGTYRGANGYFALSLYECGAWFLKLTAHSDEANMIEVNRLERLAVDVFDPSGLTALDPLRVADVHIAPAAFQDSTMLACALANAEEKLRWSRESVSGRERASGFPDIYLDLHIRSWEAFVRGERQVKDHAENQYKTDFTTRYLRDWESIIESGFLAEFLMDRYNMLMVPPENLEMDMEGYLRWQADHPIDIDLNRKYSMIVYSSEGE